MATTTPSSTPETTAGGLRIAAPAAVTLASLVSGFAGLVLAAGGHIEGAVGMVYLAALFDAMDGRLARALGGGSRFGAELDSLADVVCFGALPALILYQWLLHEAGVAGFAGAASLSCAAAVRLARFNVAADDPDRPRWTAGYFVGVPAPAGALLALSPIYLAEAGWLGAQNPYLMAAVAAGGGRADGQPLADLFRQDDPPEGVAGDAGAAAHPGAGGSPWHGAQPLGHPVAGDGGLPRLAAGQSMALSRPRPAQRPGPPRQGVIAASGKVSL